MERSPAAGTNRSPMEQRQHVDRSLPSRGNRTMEVSTTQHRRRFVVGIMLALALVASVASPALAHYIKQTPWVYRSAQICTLAGAEISHGDFQSGYNWGQTQAWTRNYSVPPPFWDCKFPSFQPAGYIALQRDIYWWNGSSW